jgi:ribonuclease P protein component
MREAHVPAQQPPPQAQARLPLPDANARRPGDHPRPPGPRAQSSLRLIWRIRDRATFGALRGARRHRRGVVTVRVVPVTRRCDPPRVAYAVGRNHGGAVARNRVRRRLRAAVAAERDALCAGAAYLVTPSPAAAHVPFPVLRTDLRDALTRSRVEL